MAHGNPPAWPTILAAGLVCGLLGGCGVRQMIYPAPPVSVPSPPPAPLEEVDLALPDDTRVSAWHLPVEGVGPARKVAVLFFHGNGENLETMRMSGFFEDLAELGVSGLAVDYPGYGRSGGRPSEAALTASAEVAGEWLAERYPERNLVVVGWSLGAAVAVRQAADAPERWRGLVALSPWVSLPELARTHFPDWLVGLALNERHDSLATAPELRLPVLVVHGREDRIIPAEHGRRLAGSIPDAEWLEIPGTGHNDLLARPETWRALSRFLDRIATGPVR